MEIPIKWKEKLLVNQKYSFRMTFLKLSNKSDCLFPNNTQLPEF